MDRTRSLVDVLGCLFFINYFFAILFFCVLTHAHTYTTNYNLLGLKFPFINKRVCTDENNSFVVYNFKLASSNNCNIL